MKSLFVKEKLLYDGSQLTSHFAYKKYGIPGNSIIAFIGAVKVDLGNMVDIEDVINKQPIASDEMLNFIIELYDMDLVGTICLQRLFICIIQDELNRFLRGYNLKGFGISRDGDDLYYDGRKLSVSIATVSPISALIHTALNIKSTGVPAGVAVACLEEIGINHSELGERILDQFVKEFMDIQFARTKVNWVK